MFRTHVCVIQSHASCSFDLIYRIKCTFNLLSYTNSTLLFSVVLLQHMDDLNIYLKNDSDT